MGRKPKREEEYLMAALEVFWKKGYEGASMSELTENLGIGAQSIYNKFGDKMGLYHATLQFFIDMSDLGLAISLKSKPDASLPEIIFHFMINRRMQLMDNSKEACYVAVCALEMGTINPRVQELSNEFFTLLKEGFKGAVINAQNKGEISKDKDADNLAWYLVNAINSFGIMKKSGIHIEQIDSVMKFTFSVLDAFTDELFELKKQEVEKLYPILWNIMYESEWWKMEIDPQKISDMLHANKNKQ